jgi:acetyl esterase/lipase
LLAHAARAIAEIRNRAQRYGYDGSRIVLVGDGWGAFTAALLATHPDHLAQAGVDIGSIKAVVLIEPSGLDFPREKALASAPRRKELARLAPGGAAAEKRLSPRHQLAPPNAPRFLLMPVKQDEKGMAKAREFESALKAAGVDVDLHPVNRSQEHNLPSYLGFPTNPNNEVLNRFLAPVMVRAP